MISILDIIKDTMVDGPGFRTAIYCAGCDNACPGCHNPQSWDIRHGHWMTTDELLREVMDDEFADVTFTGGDPMMQAKGFAELAAAIRHNCFKTIWCYTGYKFEWLLQQPDQRELMRHIDVLVDGPFVLKLRNPDLLYRGSSNQRIIDVQPSLRLGRPVVMNDEQAMQMGSS